MKMKRSISAVLAGLIIAGTLVGCGGTKNNGKIQMEAGNWPNETNPERVELYKQYAAEFEKKYPDIDVIEGNTYGYDPKTFMMKSSANQLPSHLDTAFTEVQQMISAGQVADVTDALKANGLYDEINPDMLELCSDGSGKVYGLPTNAYAIGLIINKDLFAKAGLVNADGTPKTPQTYQELAEYAQLIKEKTGAAGFVMPSVDNIGGWLFMNIAWSFGVEFEEKQNGGKWKAVFDTPQFKNAIQYVKDLRWKYNALPDNKVINMDEMYKLMGTGQVAMMLASPDAVGTLCAKYGMNKDDVYMARVPGGDAGRYAQMGGSITIFDVNNTPEETDAAIKWMMFRGHNPEITDEVEQKLRSNCEAELAAGKVVFPKAFFPVWISEERRVKTEAIWAEYANVDMADYEDYASFDGVTIRPEESACCQQLYSVLDGVIQAVITDKNSDVNSLTKTAVNDFQKNHLDNM